MLLEALHAALFEELPIAHDIAEALGKLANDDLDNRSTVCNLYG
jgi:hypothetical protein